MRSAPAPQKQKCRPSAALALGRRAGHSRRAHRAPGTPAHRALGTLTHRAFGYPQPYASVLRAHALSPRHRRPALLRRSESRRSSLWATSRSYSPSAPASSKRPGLWPPTRSATTPEARPPALGRPLGLRGEPSPRGCPKTLRRRSGARPKSPIRPPLTTQVHVALPRDTQAG